MKRLRSMLYVRLVGDGCPAEGLKLANEDGGLVAIQTVLPGIYTLYADHCADLREALT